MINLAVKQAREGGGSRLSSLTPLRGSGRLQMSGSQTSFNQARGQEMSPEIRNMGLGVSHTRGAGLNNYRSQPHLKPMNHF